MESSALKMAEHPIISHRGAVVHREGRNLLLMLGAIWSVSLPVLRRVVGDTAFKVAAALSAVSLAFTARFFRHPGCTTPLEGGLVVSPAEGRVVHIGVEREGEYFGDHRVRVSIFLSVFNAHLTRSPARGKVVYQRYHPGRYLVALHPKSSSLNERNSIAIEDAAGKVILVRQIAGFLARRIRSYVQSGETVAAGEEIGFIKFGSRVDLFLPEDCELLVSPGQPVVAGETRIARLRSESPSLEPASGQGDQNQDHGEK